MSSILTDNELKNSLGKKRFEILHPFASDREGTCCNYYTKLCWLCDCCKYCCRWNEKQRENMECAKEDRLDLIKLSKVTLKRQTEEKEQSNCKVTKY